MAAYPIPDWIRPPADIAGEYLRGVQLGSSIASEQQRLQQQAAVQSTELAIKQQQAQQDHLLEQQRMEISKAYQQQEIGLKQQQLAQAQQLTNIKTQDAARKLQARTSYQDWLNQGRDPVEGILRFFPGTDESMTGYGAVAKDMQLKNFVPKELQVGNQQLIQTSPTAYHVVPPQQATSTGPVKAQQVLDPTSGKPLDWMIAVPGPKGMEYRNRPTQSTRRQEKELDDLRNQWTARGANLDTGDIPKDLGPTTKRAFDADRKRYQQLKNLVESGQPDEAPKPAAGKRYRFNPQSGKIEPVAAQDTEE